MKLREAQKAEGAPVAGREKDLSRVAENESEKELSRRESKDLEGEPEP